MNYLNLLNPRQLEAVKTIQGPLLILAGAGSGKTRTVITRIVYILDTTDVKPYEILALTFTNKAASEMAERIAGYGIAHTNEIWMGTFHSICARILRRHAEAIGFNSRFTIYDEDDSKKVVTECLNQANITDKSLSAEIVRAHISKAKENYILPDEYAESANDTFRFDKIAEVYKSYQSKLKSNNAMDFDDLLLNTLLLFEASPDTLSYYQNRFKFVCVDEYQDTNRLQYEIVAKIADKYKNLCVCGDDDQSIYGWRGADIRNILEFEHDFPNAKVIRLEQNYRSTANILEAANKLIMNNESRMGKNLFTDKEKGEDIRLINCERDIEEADIIAHEIKEYRRLGLNYSDMAVLYRLNAQSRVLEEGLIRAGVAYRIVGGTRFYDRAEVKDIIAYLRFVSNPSDTISFMRAIASPKRGLGAASLDRIFDYAAFKGCNIRDALRSLTEIPGLGKVQKEKFASFAALISDIETASETSLKKAVETAVNQSGYLFSLMNSADEKKEMRSENLKELVSAAGDFELSSEDNSLQAFLENIALVTGADEAGDTQGKVLLMTMHNSKGLEFDTVFLPGMEEGYFPLARAAADMEQLEEERRLCYVALTRAKKRIIISNSQYRRVYGSGEYRIPSRFIEEIPSELIKVEGYRPKPRKSIYEEENIFSQELRGFTYKNNNEPTKRKKPAAAAQKDENKLNVSFSPADKISHPSWGVGTVVSVNSSDGDTIVTAAFAGLGIKKFILGFADVKKV